MNIARWNHRQGVVRAAVEAGTMAASLTILGRSAKGQGKTLKVGLIGCGGRGNGALAQHVEAAGVLNKELGLGIEIKVTAIADYFRHKVIPTGKKYEIEKSRWFKGPDGYRKLLETDVDLVLIATPPVFRPIQFEAAVKAGKHVFMEKPAAVDPVGCRRVLAAADLAKQKGLVVVAGTQCRHIASFIETHAAVASGAIGRIRNGLALSCFGHLGAIEPLGELSTARLVYSWPNWIAMSGDHIVEAGIHQVDIMTWFLGAPPLSAVGFGGRARRRAGNQYDFFSVDYEFANDVHVHYACRQIDGCWNSDDVTLVGEKGATRCYNGRRLLRLFPREIPQWGSGHQQEQIDFLYHVAKGKPLNQAADLARSTAAAIMGRESAYTGQKIEWRDMMEDPGRKPALYNLQLKPTAEDFEGGTVELPQESVCPVPGTT